VFYNLESLKSLKTANVKIYILNIGECNKCSLALGSFFLRMADIGFKNISITNNPEETNCLIITGCSLKSHKELLLEFWKKIENNLVIISFGDCGTVKQKIFRVEGKNLKNLAIETNDLSELIPIDYIIEGCPPNDENVNKIFREILEQKFLRVK
jgi:Ni,Fe-hydrogenase III small subunit